MRCFVCSGLLVLGDGVGRHRGCTPEDAPLYDAHAARAAAFQSWGLIDGEAVPWTF